MTVIRKTAITQKFCMVAAGRKKEEAALAYVSALHTSSVVALEK